VITETEAVVLLEAANPIPDLDSYEVADGGSLVHLDILEQRSSEMTRLDTKKEQEKRTSKAIQWLTAAVVVTVAGVALLIVSEDDESRQPATPLDLATAFIDARNGYDGEAVALLFEEGAEIEGELVSRVDQYPQVAAFEQATGWEYRLISCAPQPSATETIHLDCEYQWENDWTGALGLDPIDGNSLTFRITNGRFQTLTNTFRLEGFEEPWNEFMGWVEQNHPEDVPRMVDQESFPGLLLAPPLLDETAIELWESRTREFVAQKTDESGS